MKTDCPMQCDGKHCVNCPFFTQVKLQKRTNEKTIYITPDDK